MRAPKLLPWLARKAGIDDKQALILWHQATAQADKWHGCHITADYHAEVMSRFIKALSAKA